MLIFVPGSGSFSSFNSSPPPTSNTTVTVSSLSPIVPLTSSFLGLGYEKIDIANAPLFNSTNTNLVNLYSKLVSGGAPIIRVSGNGVEQYNWVPSAPGGAYAGYGNLINIGTNDVDRFAAFLSAAGWKALYGIALLNNGSPSLAASEASYVTPKLGSSLYIYQLGNEPDIMSGAYNQNYINKWTAAYQAVQTSVSGALFSGPGTANPPPDPQLGNTQFQYYNFLQPFANDFSVLTGTGGHPALQLLTKHYYFGFNNQSVPNLLAGDPYLASYHNATMQATSQNPGIVAGQDNPAATLSPVPLGWLWEEVGSYSGGGAAGVSNAWGTALWSLDFMFIAAQGGSNGVIFHGGEGAPYSPIMTNNGNDIVGGTVTLVEPGYYAMLAFSRMVPGRLMTAGITSTLGNTNTISAYATKLNSGPTCIAVNNKDTSNTATVTINLPSQVSSPSSASSLLFTAASETEVNTFTAGGSTIGVNGSWSPSSLPVPVYSNGTALYLTVPPGSFQLITAA